MSKQEARLNSLLLAAFLTISLGNVNFMPFQILSGNEKEHSDLLRGSGDCPLGWGSSTQRGGRQETRSPPSKPKDEHVFIFGRVCGVAFVRVLADMKLICWATWRYVQVLISNAGEMLQRGPLEKSWASCLRLLHVHQVITVPGDRFHYLLENAHQPQKHCSEHRVLEDKMQKLPCAEKLVTVHRLLLQSALFAHLSLDKCSCDHGESFRICHCNILASSAPETAQTQPQP